MQSCKGSRPPEEQLACADFLLLEDFLLQMERAVALRDRDRDSDSDRAAGNRDHTRVWHASTHVDFTRFRDVLSGSSSSSSSGRGKAPPLDPLVVWTQIRSFIKGSIEAALAGRALTEEEYLDFEVFGKDRCRLLHEQRKEVYAVYKRYEQEKQQRGWWDEGDRILSLLALSRLEPVQGSAAGRMDSDGMGRDYDKVYIDEVQDYTQAEILVFVLAAGMRSDVSLFLTGDPAQAVVEGVDFRFEEVRSIFYSLAKRDGRAPTQQMARRKKNTAKGGGGGSSKRCRGSSRSNIRVDGVPSSGIPEKPLQLLVNYRCHSHSYSCY